MPIQVYSEIAPLRRVLLHRPGQELEHLVPGSLERLLFDDIPYLKGAQAEHDRFAQVLRDNGVEVVYLSKLTAEALSQDKALKEAFIRDFTQKSGSVAHRYERELQAYLGSIEDVHEMVLQTMAGIPFSDLALDHAESLTAMLHCKADFALEPIPNLYFTRDPFASVGGGVALHRMYSATRRRETLYGVYPAASSGVCRNTVLLHAGLSLLPGGRRRDEPVGVRPGSGHLPADHAGGH